MKKFLCILSFLLILSTVAGCSEKNNEESDLSYESSEEISEQTGDEVSVDISEVVDFEPSEPESSKEPSYPDGITQKDSLTLEFKSKSKKVNAVFSAVFSEINSDTEPNDGIYLQTNNGKATLLLDFVENEGITQDDLVNYLTETYNNTLIETVSDDTVTCKIDALDQKDNEIAVYLKAVIKEGGYSEAVLCFDRNEKKTYDDIFETIELS